MTIHRVFITDDEPLICHALEIVINGESDMETVGFAHNGVDALDQIAQLHPDLVIMDVRMPIMDGIECTKRLKELYPSMPILILTTYNEEQYIIEGLANGANGYLLKGLDFPQLIATLRGAFNGQYILPTEVAIKLSSYLAQSKTPKTDIVILPDSILENYSFTNRERDILLLLASRLSIKEMADSLYISEGTVKNYLTIIYEKLSVNGRYEAIQLLTGKQG